MSHSKRALRCTLSGLALLSLLVLAGCGGAQAPSQQPSGQPQSDQPAAQAPQQPSTEPIVIGSIWPLTGTSATTANDGKRGIEIAVDLINSAGGVLGRPIKIIFEDDKGDAKTGVSAVEKLMTQDKVYAIVGGIGSGLSKAYIGALQKYPDPPIYITTGAGARSIEDEFGLLKWMFYVHPWEYHYQESMAAFLDSLNPRPETIAVAHEDGLYGTSHSDLAIQLFEQQGMKVVMREAFKTGSSDLSGILTKAKSLNPDVFYWIAYGADAIVITRQSKELDFNPKLFASTVQAGDPEYYESVGGDAEYVVFLGGWMPGANYPASQTMPELFPSTQDFLAEFKSQYGTDTPTYYAPMTYSAFMSLIAGIEKAGSLEKGAVIQAMEQLETSSPMGPMKISQSRVTPHHYFKRMLVGQWQKGQRATVFPSDAASGSVVYPTPRWNQR